MATRESIEMDFKLALQQAERVEELASKISGLANKQFNDSLQQLSIGWTGENANAYIKKGDVLKDSMNVSAGELRQIASDIRSAARRVYAAEMAALSIASS